MTRDAGETDDHAFLGGRLSLRQFREGHRAGTDACLLAAALAVEAGECIVDAGAGVGAAGLAMLERAPGAAAVLIERDAPTCGLARYNILANGMTARARVVEADLFDRALLRNADLRGKADVVVSNPPFYEAGTLRPSPDRRRRDAHVLDGGGHADWLRALTGLAAPRGRLAVVHRPEALAALLSAIPAGWGEVCVRPIHPRPDRHAVRILLGARNGSRAPLSILPPMNLHDADGRFSEDAEAVHRGLGSHLLDRKRPA